MKLLKKLDLEIDYIGQSYSCRLMTVIFTVGYIIALVFGLVLSNLKYTLFIGIATAVVCFIMTVPSWPYFRRHLLKFKKPIKEKSE